MANYKAHENRLLNSDDMTVLVFPGANNSFTMYEDAGDGNEYAQGAYATTQMQLAWSDAPVFTVKPAQGDLSLIPAHRTWRIGLRGFNKDISAKVLVNGKETSADMRWEQATNTLWVVTDAAVADEISVAICGEKLLCDNSDVKQRIDEIIQFGHCTSYEKIRLLERLKDTTRNLRSQYNFAVSFMMLGSVGGAIMELLCLTTNRYDCDSYCGNELPE